jgi:hypothetical protein
MTAKIHEVLAALTCVVAGIAIAALPHFLAWAQTGRLDYVSTVDDRYYLAVGSQAYFNHLTELADPVQVGDAPSVYRRLPFLPGVWAAKLLDLGPLGIGLMWRVLAGATVGLAWYVLLRHWIEHPWVAAALVLILLSDPGLCSGFPLTRHVSRILLIARTPSGTLLPGGHWMHLEWRVVNPATTMVFLIAVIWTVVRARKEPTRGRILLAGGTFGLLFYVFFYYWTAAGLALLLALVLDAGQRRVYFHTSWIGGLLGLPVVVSDFLLKQRLSPDWFLRCDRFLPIGRFTELNVPKDVLVVCILGLAWVLFRRRDLIFVWSLGTAGLLLANEQVVSGLQIENYHWAYVWGPAFSFFLVLTGAEVLGARFHWSPRVCLALILVGVAAYGVGMWIRAVESTRCVDPVHNLQVIAAYRTEFSPNRPWRFEANSVVAGDLDGVDFAAILDNQRPLANWSVYLSPSVSDAELDERTALNAVLLGTERATFESSQHHYYETFDMGPWMRDPSQRPLRVTARLAAYDRVLADLPAALDRFGVRYVVLTAGDKPDYLAQSWTPVAIGPTWDVWERTGLRSNPSPQPPPRSGEGE